MESIDIIDINGKPTGRVVSRGTKLNRGEYYLGVHIYIENSKGEYLIQKRAKEKSSFPNVWDLNMGHAMAGEKSIEAAIREIHEEIGVRLQAHEMNFIYRLVRHDINHITDVWKVNRDLKIEELRLQTEELSEVKYVRKEELIKLLEDRSMNRPYRPVEYIEVIRKML